MSDQPRIGLAVIARDEAQSLPRLLASIEGCFDQVVLVDTGSKDDTIAVFRAWAATETQRAAERDGRFMHTVKSFDWSDDFAAARAYADSLFHDSIEWLSWADCDDELHGAANLRALAANAPAEVGALIADYDYLQDEQGVCVCRLRRERLVRRGRGVWEGRVHEAQAIQGAVMRVDPQTVEWRHRKHPGDAGQSNRRNLRILRTWQRDEPTNPRVLGYLGTEELGRGRAKQAVRWFRAYLRLKTGWDEERAQVHRKLAIALMALGRRREAIATALEALTVMPSWPDSYLTLAEAHFELGETTKAEHWARQALAAGAPDTMLIINPLDYVVQPRVVLAGSLAAQGQLDEAIALAEEALSVQPGHQGLRAHVGQWRGRLKRETTARSFVQAAELLVAHDEQAKALILLEQTVPHYATDHPAVVAQRSRVRERLAPLFDPEGYASFYEEHGSTAADFIPDDQVLALGDNLPRARFLLAGIEEQAAELEAAA